MIDSPAYIIHDRIFLAFVLLNDSFTIIVVNVATTTKQYWNNEIWGINNNNAERILKNQSEKKVDNCSRNEGSGRQVCIIVFILLATDRDFSARF